MKIALIGYGKMGKAIEAIAVERGHEIVLKIDVSNSGDLTPENLQKAQVAIEFTGPESAYANINTCLDAGVPLVSGSTGWLQHLPDVQQKATSSNGAFLYASNYSLGVNVFFEVNKLLAKLMAPYPDYNISMVEVHHTAKLDAPSGTAITLAEQVLQHNSNKSRWVNDPSASDTDLVIESRRIDPAPGTHTIKYSSAIDDIEITHTAHNRQGFALGAVIAAEFLHNKKGIYTMKDVLGL